MKKILILLFFPLMAFSQEVPKEFRKANTMIISVSSLNDVASAILDAGHDIEDINEDLGTIRTIPKSFGAAQWQIRVRVKDGVASFQNFSSMEIMINSVTSGGFTLSNFSGGTSKSPQRKMSDGLYFLVKGINPEIRFENR